MSDIDQMDHYVNRIHELNDCINELERRNAMLVEVMKIGLDEIIATGESEGCCFGKDEKVEEKLRSALSATSADTEAWLQAEIVKRLGEPVAWMREYPVARYEIFVGDGWRYAQGFVTKLYRLPSPLATPEERIKEGRI